MFPFDSTAYGLNGLLSMKAAGKQPMQLEEQLRATLDATELYLVGIREVLSSQSVAINAGGGAFTDLTVPAGQLWWIHDYTLIITTPAAGAFTGQAAISFNAASGGTLGIPVSNVLTLGASTSGRTQTIMRPWLLRSGEVLGYTNSSVTGAVTGFGGVVLSRLRI